MNCSDVIKKLQEIIELDGDLQCYICQIYAEDEGELTEVKAIETCVLGHPDGVSELVRIMDWVD